MDKLGTVQQKISCVLKTCILDEPSNKRSFQQFRVVATNEVKDTAIQDHIDSAIPTEKLDGTCVYIAEWQGNPWLWARLDRKPNKVGDRKFKKFQSQQKQNQTEGSGDVAVQPFHWDVAKDFKDVPVTWVPALGIPIDSAGEPTPDDNGHIPGWVPVDTTSRQHCWHLTSVDLQQGLALVLREESPQSEDLYIEVVSLSDIVGKTAELIGTHVNANPYGLGSKQCPLHMLVVHGSIRAREVPSIPSADALKPWFSTSSYGSMEGVVWHCSNGALYKIHRHHLNLKWPIERPYLCTRKVKVNMTQYTAGEGTHTCLWTMSKIDGQICDSLHCLPELLKTANSGSVS